MTARRIARELAVILFPQLPRNEAKLEKVELDALLAKAVWMLVDYARQSLSEADALRVRAAEELLSIEADHPLNEENVETLVPVPLTSEDLRKQLYGIERAIHLVSEALDIPEIAALQRTVSIKCAQCGHANEVSREAPDPSAVRDFLFRLVSTFAENRQQVDEFIRHAKAKWRIERMVSIDRDILRLACVEAYFMRDIPIPVAINEAVELSKRFADEKAAKFINGILGDLAVEANHFRKTGHMPERSQSAGNESEAIPVSS